MRIEMMNEAVLFYRPCKQETSDYRIKDIVKSALSVRDTKSAVSFLRETPYSFLKAFRSDGSYVEARNKSSEVPYSELLVMLNKNPPDVFSKLKRSIDKCDSGNDDNLDISYLDDFALNSGDFGEVSEPYKGDSVADSPASEEKTVNMKGKGYAVIPLTLVANFFTRVQTLLGYIARVNREDNIQVSNNLLNTAGETIAKYTTIPFYELEDRTKPIQRPQCKKLFSQEALQQVAQSLEQLGYIWGGAPLKVTSVLNDVSLPYRVDCPDDYFIDIDSKHCGEVFVYPPEMNEKEIAANIVTSFLNHDAQADKHDTKGGDTLIFNGVRFRLKKPTRSPLLALDDEIAHLAYNDSVHPCPTCKRPVWGKGKTNCSKSCKTKANDRRREEAYRLAWAGASVEQVVEVIGEKHKEAIARWVEEARARVNSCDSSIQQGS